MEIIDYPLIYRDIAANLLAEVFPRAKIVVSDSSASTPPRPQTSPNLVVGKDVFEHVHDPKAFLTGLMDGMAERSILAVDIYDRKPEPYQHVTLELSQLEDDILSRGFRFTLDTSRVRIYERGSGD